MTGVAVLARFPAGRRPLAPAPTTPWSEGLRPDRLGPLRRGAAQAALGAASVSSGSSVSSRWRIACQSEVAT